MKGSFSVSDYSVLTFIFHMYEGRGVARPKPLREGLTFLTNGLHIMGGGERESSLRSLTAPCGASPIASAGFILCLNYRSVFIILAYVTPD